MFFIVKYCLNKLTNSSVLADKFQSHIDLSYFFSVVLNFCKKGQRGGEEDKVVMTPLVIHEDVGCGITLTSSE